MSRYFNPRFAALSAYVPGEQPRDKKYIKLNTNESPYPPSPAVIKVLEETDYAEQRLYPDPDCRELKRTVAGVFGCDESEVFIGDGSDSVLSAAFAAFGGDGIVFADVTYGFDPVLAAYHGIDALVVPLEDDLTLDPGKLKGHGRAVVITEPNAPTGLCVGHDAIEDVVRSDPDHVVIVDEAYIDFGGVSSIDLVRKYPNVLVVRTLSKSRQLAGARVGFAVGNRELIADMETLKFSVDPYFVTRSSLAAAAAAIRDTEYFDITRRKIIAERERTESLLGELGFEFRPSMTNFVFVRHPAVGGGELYERLKAAGILVRHFGSERIKDYIRVTVGTPEEMDAFIAAVGKIIGEAGA